MMRRALYRAIVFLLSLGAVVAAYAQIGGGRGIGGIPASPSFTSATLTGQLHAEAGTSSAPAIVFGSDTDFGLFRCGTRCVEIGGAGNTNIFEVKLGSTTTTQSFDLNIGGGCGTEFHIGAEITGCAPYWPGNGAASAPQYSFASDSNTGIYRSAADVLGFATGGAARLLISSAAVDLQGVELTDSTDDVVDMPGGLDVLGTITSSDDGNTTIGNDLAVVGDLNVTGTFTASGISSTYGGWVQSSDTTDNLPSGWSASYNATGCNSAPCFTITHTLTESTKHDLALTCVPMLDGTADATFCQVYDSTTSSVTVRVIAADGSIVNEGFFFTAVQT